MGHWRGLQAKGIYHTNPFYTTLVIVGRFLSALLFQIESLKIFYYKSFSVKLYSIDSIINLSVGY